MSTGRYRGERLGACTDCRRFWAQYRAGGLDAKEIGEIEGNLATTAGTCAVMGTASTMAILCEALGLMLKKSEEHTSELQSLMRISYAVFCLQKKNTRTTSSTSNTITNHQTTKHTP